MGFGLKILSILTGSDEKTLLNARSEIENKTNMRKNLSNNSEKEYVLNTLARDIINNKNLPRDIERGISHIELVTREVMKRTDANDAKFVVILNRVLVHYYGYELGDSRSLAPAVDKLTYDIMYILSNEFN